MQRLHVWCSAVLVHSWTMKLFRIRWIIWVKYRLNEWNESMNDAPCRYPNENLNSWFDESLNRFWWDEHQNGNNSNGRKLNWNRYVARLILAYRKWVRYGFISIYASIAWIYVGVRCLDVQSANRISMKTILSAATIKLIEQQRCAHLNAFHANWWWRRLIAFYLHLAEFVVCSLY